jgi:hypothetical protein
VDSRLFYHCSHPCQRHARSRDCSAPRRLSFWLCW